MTGEGKGFLLALGAVAFEGALIGLAWWQCWAVVFVVVAGTISLGFLVALSCAINEKALWSQPRKRKDRP